MWFKNLMIYRLTRPLAVSVDQLAEQLQAHLFTPCASQDKTRIGWVAPMGSHSQALVHTHQTHHLLCLRKEEKILPAPVIKQALEQRVDKLEAAQKRKLKKIEKTALKEDVLHSLLPQAFSRFSHTFLWLNTQENLVIIDGTSSRQSEEALAILRKCLGSLPVVPLSLDKPIAATLTHWVSSAVVPACFALADEIELKGHETSAGILRGKNVDLSSEEIIHHISAGKEVTKLALTWQTDIRFLLHDDITLKRVRFSEHLQEKNQDIDRDDVRQRFDADFILMSSELTALINDLIAALEG